MKPRLNTAGLLPLIEQRRPVHNHHEAVNRPFVHPHDGEKLLSIPGHNKAIPHVLILEGDIEQRMRNTRAKLVVVRRDVDRREPEDSGWTSLKPARVAVTTPSGPQDE